jgi:hypothetical protein
VSDTGSLLCEQNYKLVVIGEDEDLHDTFFIAHLAFISPSLVLQMLIRQYNESLVHDDQKR